MRLIPAKPREVRIWGSVMPSELYAGALRLRPFLQKVEAGQDLTPHLSNLVKTKKNALIARSVGKDPIQRRP